MREIIILLESQLKRLESMIESRRAYVEAIKDNLSIVRRRNRILLSAREKGSSDRVFLSKDRDEKTILILATKLYYEKLLPLAVKRKLLIESLLAFEKNAPLEEVYTTLPNPIKEYVDPFEAPLEKVIYDFESEEYSKLDTRAGNYMIKTEEGIMVRSKAEMVINDTLFKSHIPHKYEKPLKTGNITLRPDFTVINRKTGKQFIWEHFGMMDNPIYVDKFLKKLKVYEDAGYYLYDGLIATFSGKDFSEKEFEMEVFTTIRNLLV